MGLRTMIRRALQRVTLPELHITNLHEVRAQVSNSRRLDEIEARLRLMQAQRRFVTARDATEPDEADRRDG
jgi:hypothetical protein